MRRSLVWPVAAAIALWTGASVLNTPVSAAPSIRDVLTPEEFQRAGLQKLTAAELAYLSERLLPSPPAPVASGDSTAAPVPRVGETQVRSLPAALPHGDDAFGQEEKLHVRIEEIQRVPKEVHSRIEGVFTGWTGRTLFRLANGQVWQQSEPGAFAVNLTSPKVIIRRGLLGVFYLQVEGYGTQVKVKRVK